MRNALARLAVAILGSSLGMGASAQNDPLSIVSNAEVKAGFTKCDAPFDQWIRRPDLDPVSTPATKSRIQVCKQGKAQLVWRISPTPAGPGINDETLIVANYRKPFGTHLMWVAPHRAYVPHRLFFAGRTNQSGPLIDPLTRFEDWDARSITLPFIPAKVVYFGSEEGVIRIGFTDLIPLPGYESKMYPLRRDSVVMALSGAGFRTSQSYVRFFSSQNGGPYLNWRKVPAYVEVQYYQSSASVKSATAMEADARVAYLPIYPVSDVRKPWDVATSTPGAIALTMGTFGDAGLNILGPLAGLGVVMDAVGFNEEDYQRAKARCYEAGGIC